MKLIQKLKALLGFEERDSEEPRDVSVTVEREGEPTPATETEAAVKGTDEPQAEAGTTTDSEDQDETAESDEAPETAETKAEAETRATDEPGGGKSATESEPDGELTDIKGIGPSYADRLRDAGVDSIAELAARDAEELAAETDISAKRLGNWIEQAEVR